MNKNIIPPFSSVEQTKEINNILGMNADNYTIYDIYQILPWDITFNCRRGYLSVNPIGIEWTSLNSDWKVNLVHVEHIYPNKNVFDAFIKVLNWIDINKNEIQIN